MKIRQFIVVFILCSVSALVFVPKTYAQRAMNNPYVDDKLFHFGFQLGVNFATFGVTDSGQEVDMQGANEILHARVSSVVPGFHVGFVSDLRLCKYLNLRFCPGLQFTSRGITYKSESGKPVRSIATDMDGRPIFGSTIDILAMPIYLPLYLKFSSEREGNYRPYVIAGGGVSFNVLRDANKPIILKEAKNPDYFCEVGFGCDLYFRWFKWCPEITYRCGFANVLCPAEDHPNLSADNAFYTNAISRLTTHCVCLTFNFE